MDQRNTSTRIVFQRIFVGAVVFVLALLVITSPASAQMPRDLRDQFERLIPDLDPEVAKCFQSAMDAGCCVVEFTPGQFRKFRDNPVNPFEDTYRIEPDDKRGNISLNFEMPSLRNRRVEPSERQNLELLSALAPVVNDVGESMVGVWKDDRMIALGTIVSSDGYIITKASEVQKRAPVECVVNGEKVSARIERIDEQNDVALLKVGIEDLKPISWSEGQTVPGSFVLTPGVEKAIVALGTYAASPRSTVSGEQAFLGVNPDKTAWGVRVSEIQEGDASHNAGLIDGDVITEMGGEPIAEVGDLVNAVRRHRPGDKVEIKFLRGGNPMSTRATLAGRNLSGEQAARFKMMNRMGTIVSRRADNFPFVFQHDAPLFPEHCGGPVVDLDGKVVGINIARQGRASSLAIPASRMKEIVKELTRSNVAARP